MLFEAKVGSKDRVFLQIRANNMVIILNKHNQEISLSLMESAGWLWQGQL